MADNAPTQEQEVWRGERARQILEDELFKAAVADIERALLDGIAKSAFIDERLREKLCQRYALLQDLVGQLRAHIETGRMAAWQLDQRKNLAERAKQFFRAV